MVELYDFFFSVSIFYSESGCVFLNTFVMATRFPAWRPLFYWFSDKMKTFLCQMTCLSIAFMFVVDEFIGFDQEFSALYGILRKKNPIQTWSKLD